MAEVILESFENCAILRLNRPSKLNALSGQMLDELSACLDRIEADSARALIVTGAGVRAFSAGADLGEASGFTPEALDERNRLARLLFQRLHELPIISVAAINGAALGGGLELALACTFRIASAQATMGLPEIKLGLMPCYGGTQRLPALVGPSPALELMLSGRSITAQEALQIGLIQEIFEGDATAAGIAFAKRFTGFSLAAQGFIRQAVSGPSASQIERGLEFEGSLAAQACRTLDAVEGIASFIERRAPQFTDG